jgi:tetratricopeptide (TPR) repeat protein
MGSYLQRLGQVQAWLCDGLVLLIIAILLGYPLLAAFVQDTFENLPVGSLFGPSLDLLLSRLDSGAQLGQGPYVIRGLETLLVALPGLFPRPARPLSKQIFWPLIVFHLISFTSAIVSEQRYSGLVQAYDSLLVTLVALRIRELIPSNRIKSWQVAFIGVQAALLPACWRQYLQRPLADSQLNGPFHHSNMIGTYSLIGVALGFTAILYQIRQRETRSEGGSFWIPGLSVLVSFLGNSDRTVTKAYQMQSTLGLLALLCIVSAFTTDVILSGSRAALLIMLYLSWAFYWLLYTTKFNSKTLGKAILLGMASACACLVLWFSLERFASPNLPSLQVLAVIVGLAAILLTKRSWLKGTAVVCMILTTATLTNYLQSSHVEGGATASRLHNIVKSDSSVGARVCFYVAALRMTAEHPIFGVGPGGFHRFYPQHQTDTRYFSKYVHCVPLAVLCENGLPAFLALSWALAAIGFYAWKALFSDSQAECSPDALWRLGTLANLALLLGCSLFDVHWQFPYFQFLAAFQLGLAISLDDTDEVSPQVVEDDQDSRWKFRPWVVLNQASCALLVCCLAINVWSANSYSYQELAQRAASMGKFEEANTLYLYSLSLSPLDSELNHKFGICLLSQLSQLPDEKRRLLHHLAQNCVALDSHRAVHYDLLGKVAEADNNLELYHQCALKTLEIDPMNFPSFYTNLSQAQAKLGNKMAALCTVWNAMDRFPEGILAQIFDFRRDSLNRNFAELNLQAADLSDPVKNPKIAIGYYDQALHFAPDHAQAKFGRAVCLYHLEKYQESVAIFEELYKNQPDALYLLAYVVNCYVGLNDGPKAREKEKLYKELERKQKDAATSASPPKK